MFGWTENSLAVVRTSRALVEEVHCRRRLASESLRLTDERIRRTKEIIARSDEILARWLGRERPNSD